MLKTTIFQATTITALTLLAAQGAWAEFNELKQLPGPGIVGLVVAGIIVAIAISRSRK